MSVRSLGTRLSTWYGGVLAVCLVAYSVAVVVIARRQVMGELDRQVHEDIELAVRAVVVSPEGTPAWRDGIPPWSGVHEEPGGGALARSLEQGWPDPATGCAG